ncbi:TPA: recombination regulator RecX [Legionella pneumophila]|uniref:Regulatory protein RecX n=1 Tax=Legionella pneumophila TaxID=446 RepID=A0AAN5Q188_LEGPN|nr:recombination regulator RecX [Legionella pneumophila]TIH01989.1 recombination regulator RecX [Legionella pneumophila]HAT3856118.1 recombination regulator RecX [Legionella pneumophila]HAT3865815.1 recombination regulator RecX [Legionella pneumophila]HAT3875364.1 recombination regulator RecX [Legionella pneumophila]HAT3971292.1 recombination regulator RecX [Legionella pneumophila]
MTKAFDSALRLLSRREYSAMELCDKLKQKGFNLKDVQNALNECKRLGYQSDERYVESYIRARIHQGYGPLKIRQELKNKGIDPDLIQSVLHQEKDNWVNYALRAWEKKFKRQDDFSYSEMQKQHRFLLYRGFDRDVISKVFKEVKSSYLI